MMLAQKSWYYCLREEDRDVCSLAKHLEDSDVGISARQPDPGVASKLILFIRTQAYLLDTKCSIPLLHTFQWSSLRLVHHASREDLC